MKVEPGSLLALPGITPEQKELGSYLQLFEEWLPLSSLLKVTTLFSCVLLILARVAV